MTAISLISRLTEFGHLSPDEIASAINDPLSKWQEVTEFVTPENYDSICDRDIAMYSVAGGNGQLYTGFYSHDRIHMVDERYSYRCESHEHAQCQNMDNYDPPSAASCGGWWMIGWEYRDRPVPTTIAAPSHDRYEDYDDDDPDY